MTILSPAWTGRVPSDGSPDPSPPGRKRLHVITWGCQMNVYDSGRMADLLEPLGYAATSDPAAADMVILNTCHIRERATEKVFSELGRLRLHKEERALRGERTVIAVAGCVAQAEGAEILARAPFVDIVLGTQSYHRLPEMVARASRAAGAAIDTEFPPEEKFDLLPEARGRPGQASAFLAVQEGCDKFCAFCVVPYTRGAEWSRPVAAVIAEARALAAAGAREITLLGQNVNAYHGLDAAGRPAGLAALIEAVAAVPGVARIRYTTSHPGDMTPELRRAHRDVPALMPFLHLPVQSGSDRILRAMNRGHDRARYLDEVAALRDARPDLALSTDFIVGFPGETDREFDDTLLLAREVGFASAYSFKYSPRPGTPAAAAPGHLPEATKDARLQALQAVLRDSQRAFNADTVGRTLPVLFTGPGRHPGQIGGRTPYGQAVHVDGPIALAGTIAPVLVTASATNSISGRLIRETARA